jgi:uncharacterized protein (DUF58 family)
MKANRVSDAAPSRAAARSKSARHPAFLPCVSLVLLLVFLFTPFYLIQFIALFLLLLCGGSAAYSKYLRRNITITRRDSELRAFRYAWADIEIIAENHGSLPAFMLAVNDTPGRVAVFRNIRRLCTLRARSRLALAWNAYCADRGVFDLGPVIVRGCDPLGLFPFHLSFTESTKLFVYPAPALADIKNPGGIPLGTLITPNILYEDLTRCRSLRPYHAGDEPRRVNWKASARVSGAAARMSGANGARNRGAGVLMVNEYEATVSFPIMIFLNLAPEEYNPRRREVFLERAIEVAAALCLMAARLRQQLGAIFYTSPEKTSVFMPGAFNLVPILERLAAIEHGSMPTEQNHAASSSETLLARGKFLPYGTRLFYVGPNLSDAAYRLLSALKRYHLTLEYLIIDEHSLSAVTPDASRRYQIKESGYEII